MRKTTRTPAATRRLLRVMSGLAAAMIGVAATPGASIASVTIVHDGADGAPAAIRIQSGIRKGDYDAFMAAANRLDGTVRNRINGVPFITVELASPGGDVVEALQIGRAIYQRYMMTVVRSGDECVSACAFIMMAGAVHTPAAGAEIGVHRPLLVSWRNMNATEARAKYDALMAYIRSYFIELGVDPAAYDVMMRTNTADMHYFSASELDRLGLRGSVPAWDRLYKVRAATLNAVSPQGRQTPVFNAAPPLRPVDPSWRTVVFMPGAGLEGVFLPAKPASGWHLAWTDIDDDAAGQTYHRIAATPSNWLLNAQSVLSKFWWLLALIAVEAIRPRGCAKRTPRAG